MARGISTGGDVITSTVDGVELSDIFGEFQETLRLRNEARDTLRGLLTFSTTAVGDSIAQTSDVDDFEMASEFSAAKSLRSPGAYLNLGFNFAWFDASVRFTWKFLVDADRSQVEAVHASALEADNRLVFKAVMGALLNNQNRLNPEGLTVFPLYNADGIVPPEYAGEIHTAAHDHYLISGAAVIDEGDVIDLTRHVQHHGHGDPAQGGRVVVFTHPDEAEVLRNVAGYIPSSSAPAYLTDKVLVGDRAPGNLGRIPIYGSIGSAWLSESRLIPSGYVVAVAVYADGGGNDRRSVIAFREHPRSELRGLRQVPARAGEPMIQDSYYQRGFGTGVRQRGGAAVMQIKASGTYDTPATYSTVLA